MKKILLLSLIALGSLVSSAQFTIGPVTNLDTTVNTDTTAIVLPAVGSGLASIDARVVLVSGTIGGKVYLYGRTGELYNLLDSSAALTTAVPFKTFTFDRTKYTLYKDYKLEYRTNTTQTSYMIVTALRRPDER